MSRRYDPTKARRHWVYSRTEVCEKFDISESTITNWIAAGLRPVDEKRPQLFTGYELRRYLTKVRWPDGRLPEEGKLYCSFCPGFKPLVPGTIKPEQKDMTCVEVTGECIDCHNMLAATISLSNMGEIFAASASTTRESQTY